MTYKQIKNLEEKEFERLWGVKRKLFEEMVKVLEEKFTKGKPRGRQSKLSIEDQLLISLEYWREYRTYFQQLDWVCWGNPSTPLVHIAQSWGVNELTIAWSDSPLGSNVGLP